MSTNASHRAKLDALPLGVLGGAAAASAAAADKQISRIVSASCSVVSAHSLSSAKSSVKGLGNAAFASLEEKKESDEDRAATISKSSSPSVSSSENGSGGGGGNQLLMGAAAPPHPVAEFLFQLTKMLTDNNGRYIEWKSASIFVHDPPGLEKDILPKYFRHSNYSSFQRQMNYFGFRKIAGKGKMAPCSYVNEAAREDISSLLFIKRKKTGVSSAAAKLMAQQNRITRAIGGPVSSLMGMGSGAPSTGLNNLSMVTGIQGVTGGATNSLLNDQGPLYRDQQSSVLDQLAAAHASALSASQLPPAGLGAGATAGGGLSQSTSKLNLALMGQSSAAGLLTTDQGNVVYSSAANDLSGYQDAAAQSLLNGLAGYPQGLAQAGTGASDGYVPRIDSAANLRALLNQQISMFSGDAGYTAAAGNLAQSMPATMAPEPAAPPSNGLPQEWNEMLLRIGGGGTDSQGNSALRQLEQQLLLQRQGGAPSPSQSYSLNSLFGAGGAASGF